MTKPIDITDCKQIDLGKSAVIEASAGTGKTYTIENLFVRLLLEEKVPLEKILVVTFSDKAAGELRERIRSKIERSIAVKGAAAGETSRLRDALETFDMAPIFTIHGFCARILRQYAFENGEPFMTTQEDDTLLYEKLLKEQMRKSWKAWFGSDLEGLMAASGFAGNEDWVGDVARLAAAYRPQCGDRIVPQLSEEPQDVFRKFMEETKARADALSGLVGPVAAGDIEANRFNAQYGSLGLQARHIDARRRDIILPLLRLLADYVATGTVDLEAAGEIFGKVDREKGFGKLIDANMAKSGKYRILCPGLEGIIAELDAWKALHATLGAILKSCVIRKLKDEVAAYKRDRALISFDDMIDLVDRSLGASDVLVEELRKRYSYALVDEFQDTDKAQWHIFRRIFLGSPAHRLYMIGDPKQAIYSFRGADVFAYIDAKAEMISGAGADYYSLATNWRSTGPLIDAFNRLFSGSWFADAGLEYMEVRAPEKAKRRSLVYADLTGRAAVTAVNVDGVQDVGEARYLMSRFIADEIERLIKPGAGRLVVSEGGRPVEAGAGDICVLLKARKSARLIQRFLDRKGIPYSFYKKAGLFRTEEATHIRYILEAIVDPSDARALKKALMTPFFGISPDEVGRYAELSGESGLKELFTRWYEYADERRWPRLFQSILEDTGMMLKSGVTERRMVNYQHIFERLGTEAISHSLDLVDIAARLRRYREEDKYKDDMFDLQRLETEKPKVRFMTIHASKGMEFPVVFIADGFGELNAGKAGVWKYHDDKNAVVYDMAKTDRAAFDRERQREYAQLYYVAFTRAKYKLYLPKFSGMRNVRGPLVRPTAAAIGAGWESGQSDAAMLRFVDPEGKDLAGGVTLKVVVDAKRPAVADETKLYAPRIPKPLVPDFDVNFAGRKLEIESYSHLSATAHGTDAQKAATEGSWITFYEEPAAGVKEEDDDEAATPAPEEAAAAREGRGPILPSSNVTGSMLHEVMETIDFAKTSTFRSGAELVADGEMRGIIERLLRRYAMVKPGEAAGALVEAAADIVWKTLNTGLTPFGRKLSILKDDDRIHELEFYYPFPRPQAGRSIKDIKYREGYLMGFIDLVFRAGDRYFILDWKSNYLDEGYSQESLERSMAESGYDLQYKVYSIAMLKWLRSAVRGFDYEKNFGGVYYIYMRGLDPAKPDEGALFRRAAGEAEIASYEDELLAILNPKVLR